MTRQKTLAHPVEIKGIGIHSNKECTVRFLPAPADHGILFRSAHNPQQTLSLTPDIVISHERATTITGNGLKVQTTEHILATLMGLEITNVLIEIDAVELPIMDGSAAPLVTAIKKAGIKELQTELNYIIPDKAVYYTEGDGAIILIPDNTLRISATIDFPHPLLRNQTAYYHITPNSFAEEIAPARTFGFWHEVQKLHENGLALGGNFDIAVILNDDGYMNTELRYPDECVRHKILDLLGDLALLGAPLKGYIFARKPGHALNTAFAKALRDSLSNDV